MEYMIAGAIILICGWFCGRMYRWRELCKELQWTQRNAKENETYLIREIEGYNKIRREMMEAMEEWLKIAGYYRELTADYLMKWGNEEE